METPTIRILVVEDEIVVSEDLQQRLTLMNYEVVGAADTGAEAVALAKTMNPDIVLMDIMLHGKPEGIAAAEVVRDELDIPVIYLTAHSDSTTLKQARLTDPAGYIVKPFEEDQLRVALQLALGQHRIHKKVQHAQTNKNKRRILIVEDQTIVAEEVQKKLIALGFEVIGMTDNAADAIAMTRTMSPDIVMMDITLQGGSDGIAAAAVLRWELQTPVIYLTEQSDTLTLQRAKSTDPVAYLVQPFNDEQLRVALELAPTHQELEQQRLNEQSAEKMRLSTMAEKVRANLELEQKVTARTAELEEIKDRFVLATEASGLGIWEWDLTTNALVWDARMHEIYETSDHIVEIQLLYDFWRASVHPEDVEDTEKSLLMAIQDQTRWSHEFRLQFSDGHVKYIKATAAVKLDEAGNTSKMIGGNQDITFERNMEIQLRDYAKQAAYASQMKSDFLANMSHEIRTPMNGVIGMADLLQKTELDGRQKEYLGLIKSSASTLLALLNDILDLSKIEAGRLELDPVAFRLDESVGDLAKGFALAAHTKGLELHYYIHPSVPDFIVADPTRLSQILFNLIGNAIKFTERGEVSIEITLASEENKTQLDPFMLNIQVKDTGVGIAKDKQASIFSPFLQADNSITRKYGGTGLGLTIVHHLVSLMKGQLTLISDIGKGTDIRIELPVRFGHKDNAAVSADLMNPLALPEKLRCLAVDDNATNQRWLKDMIESWGCEAMVADSVERALTHLQDAEQVNKPFMVMLIDKNMPNASGFDLVLKIRQQGLQEPQAIIMLSSSDVEEDIKKAKDLGLHNYLLKPVKQSEVYNAIAIALDSQGKSIPRPPMDTMAKTKRQLEVLLVEDNYVNQQLVMAVLSERGHRVTLAENGEIALAKLQEKQFPVVLMDVQMPIMDGLEATRLIRQAETNTHQHQHVIGLTAHALKGDRETCIAAGMDDYLAKPINAQLLIQKIEASVNVPISPSISHPLNLEKASNSAIEDVVIYTYFDLTKSLLSTGENHTILAKMIQLTLKHLPQNVQEIDELIVTNDPKRFSNQVHKLKGMVANLCCTPLVTTLSHLEINTLQNISDTDVLDWLKIKKQLTQFQLELLSYQVEL